MELAKYRVLVLNMKLIIVLPTIKTIDAFLAMIDTIFQQIPANQSMSFARPPMERMATASPAIQLLL